MKMALIQHARKLMDSNRVSLERQ